LVDLTLLKAGSSTQAEVDQLTTKHRWSLVSRDSSEGGTTTTFQVRNVWLSAMRLEPPAVFGASVTMKDGHAHHISAWLMRSMDIYPTFGASAGMVDELEELAEDMDQSLLAVGLITARRH